MDANYWQSRIRQRADLVTRLTHLTRGNDDDGAFLRLCNILSDKKLIASDLRGINVGNEKVCCFQELPLVSIAENLRFEKSNGQEHKHYSPFGLRFLKGEIFQNGGRPVFYGDSEDLKKKLNREEHWRIVKMDLSDSQNIVDWTHEREWRYKGDYEFAYKDIEIIVATPKYYRKLIEWCLQDEKRMGILKETNGIVVLNSIYN